MGTSFVSWHPAKRSMLVNNIAKGTSQLHLLSEPFGKKVQLTSEKDPVRSGRIVDDGKYKTLVYSVDKGGNEAFQFYSMNLDNRKSVLLTDGESRNQGRLISEDGQSMAYTSDRRNNKDCDVYICDLHRPNSTRLVTEFDAPMSVLTSWSDDQSSLLLRKIIFNDEAVLYKVSVRDGKLEQITPDKEKVFYGAPCFYKDNNTILALCNDHSDFFTLTKIDAGTGKRSILIPNDQWDIVSFAVSHDEKTVAYIKNEGGYYKLHLYDLESGRHLPVPEIPGDTIGGLSWHPKLREIAFTLSSYDKPNDVYSLEVDTGKLTRWTKPNKSSALKFAKPELVHIKSFDGLEIPCFVYPHDEKRFKSPRPAVVVFHGGPESQSRPTFRGLENYLINELGVTLIYPNIRGSSGYGRRYASLDNGLLRGNAIRDAGAVIDWAANQPEFDRQRIAVMGGSYGGFMTLACLTEYNDKIRCGIDTVGISNMVTFLNNTSDFRRHHRRQEYGDERDPEVADYLQKIAPCNNADKIKAPLFIVQGENDVRVPASEAEAMRDEVRKNGGIVWYLTAKNEGHGFRKKVNNEYLFNAKIMFFKKYLLDEES